MIVLYIQLYILEISFHKVEKTATKTVKLLDSFSMVGNII
jgi:hypothetical protein